jgi:hypothetical protein
VTFAELVVEAAVDLSPEGHREVRREQWLADLRDAGELELSPLRLALGALATAVFHRSHHRRSSWEGTALSRIQPTRSTIGTVPVLAAGIVLSILMSAAFTLAFGGRHGGGSWEWYRFIGIQAVFTAVVPALGVIGIMRALHVPRTRRLLAAAALLVASVGFGGWEVWPQLGIGAVDYSYSLEPTFWGLPTIGLAAWSWAVGARGWRWAVVTGPVVLWAALLPLHSLLPVASLPLYERLPLLFGVVLGAATFVRFTAGRPVLRNT